MMDFKITNCLYEIIKSIHCQCTTTLLIKLKIITSVINQLVARINKIN
jgi:hypothetical protein